MAPQVRVWCRPDYVGDLDFANSFAADQLMWFEAYTGVNDAVPKVGERRLTRFVKILLTVQVGVQRRYLRQRLIYGAKTKALLI